MKNQIQTNITSNNGYLGSRIDEDRSEFRYLMRIAELVNHQTVERILHFFKREVSLFECVLTSLAPVCCSSETATGTTRILRFILVLAMCFSRSTLTQTPVPWRTHVVKTHACIVGVYPPLSGGVNQHDTRCDFNGLAKELKSTKVSHRLLSPSMHLSVWALQQLITPQIKEGYRLDWSILLSRGKETN